MLGGMRRGRAGDLGIASAGIPAPRDGWIADYAHRAGDADSLAAPRPHTGYYYYGYINAALSIAQTIQP
jgi:hypothetical protein